MWSRKELKEKSKFRMHANYWKTILVGLILSFLIGSGGSSIASGSRYTFDEDDYTTNYSVTTTHPDYYFNDIMHDFDSMDLALLIVIIVFIFLFVVLLVCLIYIPLQILVFNPLQIGCNRFFSKNLNEDARVKEICYSFDNGYKSAIKTMFFRSLYTFLWSLLFIIPGIVKSYEYRMIPYLLGENPTMTTEEAFARSKQMMTGNKWNAFVLDLSFIGWNILSSFTLGILGIFYVKPYYYQTCAALYETLRTEHTPEIN